MRMENPHPAPALGTPSPYISALLADGTWVLHLEGGREFGEVSSCSPRGQYVRVHGVSTPSHLPLQSHSPPVHRDTHLPPPFLGCPGAHTPKFQQLLSIQHALPCENWRKDRPGQRTEVQEDTASGGPKNANQPSISFWTMPTQLGARHL